MMEKWGRERSSSASKVVQTLSPLSVSLSLAHKQVTTSAFSFCPGRAPIQTSWCVLVRRRRREMKLKVDRKLFGRRKGESF